jgi:hypothetical protein
MHKKLHSGKRRIKTESSREIFPLFVLLNGDENFTTLIRDAAAMNKYWKIGQNVKILLIRKLFDVQLRLKIETLQLLKLK